MPENFLRRYRRMAIHRNFTGASISIGQDAYPNCRWQRSFGRRSAPQRVPRKWGGGTREGAFADDPGTPPASISPGDRRRPKRLGGMESREERESRMTKQRIDMNDPCVEGMACAVLWIGPELAVRRANRAGRALLARIDDVAKRETRLARPHGAPALANPEEIAAVRQFLGSPGDAPRRRKIQLFGLTLEVGTGAMHGQRGEFLGWVVDAVESTAAVAGQDVVDWPEAVASVDARGEIVRASTAATQLLRERCADLAFPAAGLAGMTMAELFHCEWPAGRDAGRQQFERPANRGRVVASVARTFGRAGECTGGLVTFSAVETPPFAVDRLEQEAQTLVTEALRIAAQAAAPAALPAGEPAPAV
jgi:hypothetical protein